MSQHEPTFKELEQELDAVLKRIELSSYEELDDLLKDYEVGQKLITKLEKKLQTAKNAITKAKKG